MKELFRFVLRKNLNFELAKNRIELAHIKSNTIKDGEK